ncbi:hypothetical protein DFJ43DRAFT_1159966 [Lentinula guzmanii]|uniref:Uncharacterized protein n=1 Tax=Lentinula guzmanii TaxID=2804957 RepID=A0AA38MVG2_9AGAR|nr:hypothetical protein DFJ43DRAFT_1159966 [Lentinula guzmanii]
MFEDISAKITLSSKPFDNSQDGWCEPTPHHFATYVPNARVHIRGMSQLSLHSNVTYVDSGYYEDDLPLWKAARNLKSTFATLRAKWEHSDPRQRGRPPVPPYQNAESYAASILGQFWRNLLFKPNTYVCDF